MSKCSFFIIFLVWSVGTMYGQESLTASGANWAERTYNSMSLDQKIGQLFMIRAHSDKDQKHVNQVKKYIKDYHVGGLCFFQGTPTKQARLTNDFQRAANIPLMISIDAEWGLGMRFKQSAISYPKQMTLGAIQDYNIIYEFGLEVARQLKRIGVHVNFAPVVDVNNNAENPVINTRSFGENKYNVATKAYAYMKGMQYGGVMACAKHFPGHGDTNTDSHHDLPIIPHSKQRLDSIELMPFKVMAREGIQSMMVAHLSMPALDNRPNRPTTLSEHVVQKILRDEMKFDGLIYTDAMEMKGVTKYFKNGQAEVEAILAGNDVVLLPDNLPTAFKAIKQAVNDSIITPERLKESVMRILNSKLAYGLDKPQTIYNIDQIAKDINNDEAHILNERLIEQSLTVARNDDLQIPIIEIADRRFATVSIGDLQKTNFQKRISSYVECQHRNLPSTVTAEQKTSLLKSLANVDLVFVSLHDMSKYASKNFGLTPSAIDLVNALSESNNIILSVFGSPYSLKYFDDVEHVLVAYEEDNLTQDITAQGLFGVFEMSGRLPVTASDIYKYGYGSYQPGLGRLGYCSPERVGLHSEKLLAIDTIIEEMIRGKSAPGCQVLIAKDGRIVYEKAYGYQTYAKAKPVQMDHIYDLASVTKILASTISIMKLHEDKKLSIHQPIDKYVTEADTSNKGDMIIEDIMAHHAGLPGWIPFYISTVEKKNKKTVQLDAYYRSKKEPGFDLQVTDDLYLRTDYRDSIWSRLLACSIRDSRNYKYSDLGFYMLQHAIERTSGLKLENFVAQTFYEPLGLQTTGYRPADKFPIKRIVPTENEKYFRNGVVQGYVHDMGAAMLNGVSGHAGLFSNAQDLAVLMQMLLNGGSYGGKKYLTPHTVKNFTSRYYRSSRRGIGFDMKELDSSKSKNMSDEASPSTFGHLGFTGTCAFADPENNIVFIFLSNRTYPSMNNNKFGKVNIRPRVQTVIYDALKPKNKA